MFGGASHLEVHTLKPSTSNRLRRGGLSSAPAICLAAGALVCALAGEAQASIVASGPVNIAAPTGNISIAGSPQFNLTKSKGGSYIVTIRPRPQSCSDGFVSLVLHGLPVPWQQLV